MDRAIRSGLVNHQRVARFERLQRRAQLRPGPTSASGLHDHFPAVGQSQGIQLHLVILRASGDTRVADPDDVGISDRNLRGRRHPGIVP